MIEQKLSSGKESSANIAFGAGLGGMYVVGGALTYNEVQQFRQGETYIGMGNKQFFSFDAKETPSTPVNASGAILLMGAIGLTYLFKKSFQNKMGKQ